MYKVISAMKTGEFDGKYGKLYKYAVQFEGENEAVEMNQKPDSPAPKSGDVFEGTIETTRYGRKFRKEASGGFQGQKNDPQRQASIEWQSARRDAVDYCIAKSRLLFDLGKKKEAEEELSGKHIFQVAFYFKGIETGATQLNDKLPEKQIDEPEDRNDDSAREDMNLPEEEIDVEDIPFN